MLLEKSSHVIETKKRLLHCDEWHVFHYVGRGLLLRVDRQALCAEGYTSRPCDDLQEAVTTVTGF